MINVQYNWWHGAIFYQIYLRSFFDSTGDGVGDLVGVISKLDYVASLGVDGILLAPFYVSPMKDFGYDVADHREVDPIFGTLSDFYALLAHAHKLQLKVIIDQVYSHTADGHPWFQESKRDRTNSKRDWYVWADPCPDGTPPNNWLSTFGGSAWAWEPCRGQYYLHNFLREQPDLNIHSPDVQEAILDIARFWLDLGVDGFRLDAVNFYMHDPLLRNNPPQVDLPHRSVIKEYHLQKPIYNRSRPENLAFIARLRALMDTYPGTVAIAELASDAPQTMVSYTVGQDKLHTAYSFIFLREQWSASYLRKTYEVLLKESRSVWPSLTFSNHDSIRVVSRWGSGRDTSLFAKQFIALLCSLRGTILLYQGEELGLPQAEVSFEQIRDPIGLRFWPVDKGRDGCRTPMPWENDQPFGGFSTSLPWLSVDSSHLLMAVNCQEKDRESPLNFTRRFLTWRQSHPVLQHGYISFLEAPEQVLAFQRGDESNDSLICLFNLGRSVVTFTIPFRVTLSVDLELPVPVTVMERAVHLPIYGVAFCERSLHCN